MKEALVILNSSDAAATFVTGISGWKSRTGLFFGDNPGAERAARYEGCTYVVCDCGAEVPKGYILCRDCREAVVVEKYRAMPTKGYDGASFLYSESADRYFDGWNEVKDYCDDEEGRTPENLLLVICEPQYAGEIDGTEYYCDDLPEDYTLEDCDKGLAALFDELNKYIREEKPVLGWFPGKFAVDLPASE